METTEKVRTRAMELGVYLPLGAFSKVRDEIAGIDRRKMKKTYEKLVDRGRGRLEPIEDTIEAKVKDLRGDVKTRAKTARKKATSATNKARSRADEATSSASRTAKKAAGRMQAAGSQAMPKMPRVAAPSDASRLAIKSYDSLTVEEIATRLKGLTQTDLAKVYKYERANENRSTVLESVEAKLIDLPIPTYDALTVDEINERLDGLTEGEIKTLRAYEADTKQRQTVLDRIETKLG